MVKDADGDGLGLARVVPGVVVVDDAAVRLVGLNGDRVEVVSLDQPAW